MSTAVVMSISTMEFLSRVIKLSDVLYLTFFSYLLLFDSYAYENCIHGY